MAATVSVVVPAYNAAEFVGTALDSALAQTYRDLEVIVVDDGSTDATPAILASYGSRITALRQARQGPAAARNRALREAHGSILAMLDADDCWDPEFVAAGVRRLHAAEQSLVGVCNGWLLVDRAGDLIAPQPSVPSGRFGFRDLLLGNRFQISAMLLRAGAVLDAGGFDEAVPWGVEDYDLWLSLAARGGEFVTHDDGLCRYRVHAGGLSQVVDRMRAGLLHLMRKHFASPRLPEDVRMLQPRALATVYLQTAVQLYGAQRDEEGERDFVSAVRSWPALLNEDEPYYAIACATQSLQHKASGHGLDLDAGAHRLLGALEGCRREGILSTAALRRRVFGRAQLVLARLAYGQRRMGAVRRYIAAAIAADPGLGLHWPTLSTLAKSFAGKHVVETLSRWRRKGEPPCPNSLRGD